MSNAEINSIIASTVRIGSTSNSGGITVSAPVSDTTSFGTLSLLTAGSVSESAGGTLTVTNLLLDAVGGVSAANANDAATLAAVVSGLNNAFNYNDINSLSVGTADGVNGVSTDGGSLAITSGGTLTVTDTPAANDVASAGGSITLTANAFVNNAGAAVVSGGSIAVVADNMTLNAGSSINAGAGRATLHERTAGTAIDLGGSDAAGTLGLTNGEINTVTAGTIQVGDQASGAVSITAAITPAHTSTLDLEGGSTITETTASGAVDIANLAVRSVGTVTMGNANDATTATGDLAAAVTGPGNSFVFNAANALTIGTADNLNGVTTANGVIAVTADAGNLTVNKNVSAGAANVFLTALGADSFLANNAAISDANGNTIDLQANEMALGSAGAGDSIDAAGGGRVILQASTAGRLVNLGPTTDPNGSLVLSNVELNTVTAGVLQVGNVTTIAPLGAPTLTLDTAGAIVGAGTIQAIDVTGPITVGTADGVNGITTNNGAVTVATAAGGVTVSQNVSAGTAAVSLTAGGLDSLFTNDAIISGGAATISADRMNLAGTGLAAVAVGTAPANVVTLQPTSANRAVGIDNTAGDPNGELRLGQSELSTITAGALRVGSLTAGNLTVKSSLTAPGAAALSLLSGGTISQASPAIITATNLDLQGAGGVTLTGNNVVVQLAGTTAGAAPFSFTDNHDLTVGSVDGTTGITAGTGTVSLTVENPALTATDPGLLTVANAITAAGGSISLAADNMAIDAGVNAGTTGTVALGPFDTAVTGINLGGADGNPTLGLTDAELDMVTANVLRIGSTSGATAATPITVSGTIDAETHYTTLSLKTTSTVTVANGGALSGTNLAIQANSISPSPLPISESGLAASVASGGLLFTDTNASGLTISSLDGVNGLSDTASGAAVSVTTAGPLTVAANVTAAGSGAVTLTSTDATGAGQNLTVNAGATVSSGTGNVALDAAHDITVNGTVQTSGAGTIALNGDYDNADNTGTTITLGSAGTLTATAGATITGSAFADTFNLHAINGTPLTVNGLAPTTVPGDVLNLDLTGDTGITQTTTGSGNGGFSFSNRSAVTYNSIETINATNGRFALTLNETADGNANPDVVNVSTDPSGVLTVTVASDGGTPTTFFSGLASGVSSLTVNGSTDRDTLDVDETNAGLPAINFNAGADLGPRRHAEPQPGRGQRDHAGGHGQRQRRR